MAAEEKRRGYRLRDDEEALAPSYDRVARGLTDAELEEEILLGRGDAGYQAALVAELERRSTSPPVPS